MFYQTNARENLKEAGPIFSTFWNGHHRQIEKNACKNAYLGSIFMSEKYVFKCVLKVLLPGWYPAWNTSAPPPRSIIWFVFSLTNESSDQCQALRPQKSSCLVVLHNFFGEGAGGRIFFFLDFFFQIKVEATWSYNLFSPNEDANNSFLPKNLFKQV